MLAIRVSYRLPAGGTPLLASNSCSEPTGSAVRAADEDLLKFTFATSGTSTSGAWSAHFDGSDVGLTREDIDGLWVDAAREIVPGLGRVTGALLGGEVWVRGELPAMLVDVFGEPCTQRGVAAHNAARAHSGVGRREICKRLAAPTLHKAGRSISHVDAHAFPRSGHRLRRHHRSR